MPDTNTSAVTEERRFTVPCRRQIVDRCRIFDEWTDPNIRSISAAESAFRENGWVLHSDGTASCPECIDAWENGIDQSDENPDEWQDLRVEVDGDAEPVATS